MAGAIKRLWCVLIGHDLHAADKDLHDSGQFALEEIRKLRKQATERLRKDEDALRKFQAAHRSLLGENQDDRTDD